MPTPLCSAATRIKCSGALFHFSSDFLLCTIFAVLRCYATIFLHFVLPLFPICRCLRVEIVLRIAATGAAVAVALHLAGPPIFVLGFRANYRAPAISHAERSSPSPSLPMGINDMPHVFVCVGVCVSGNGFAAVPFAAEFFFRLPPEQENRVFSPHDQDLFWLQRRWFWLRVHP